MNEKEKDDVEKSKLFTAISGAISNKGFLNFFLVSNGDVIKMHRWISSMSLVEKAEYGKLFTAAAITKNAFWLEKWPGISDGFKCNSMWYKVSEATPEEYYAFLAARVARGGINLEEARRLEGVVLRTSEGDLVITRKGLCTELIPGQVDLPVLRVIRSK